MRRPTTHCATCGLPIKVVDLVRVLSRGRMAHALCPSRKRMRMKK
jgi:hypothetical protein